MSKTTYIIFGASGDLSKRYLLPALKNIGHEHIVPISRKDYSNLKNLITGDSEKIFYLAIPPVGVPEAIKLISENFGRDNIKIILEKPFGSDVESAQDLVKHIDKYFSEEQIYRVDHYLVKESLQKVVKEIWSKKNIVKVEIMASEKIGIEGRANFYEQTGALKDFVQSHLLEMAAVTLAGTFDINRRQEALKNLNIVCDINKNDCVRRGQYAGYKDEVSNPHSKTETFVSINLVSNEPEWHGVQITLTTGKALREKLTQVIIRYKDGTEKIFRIEHEPGAYEKVVSSVIRGERDLFISSGEVLQSWRILDAIQQNWKTSPHDLLIYAKGSDIRDILKL